jgi:hypothetical protein
MCLDEVVALPQSQPNLRRLVLLTVVLFFLWFSGPLPREPGETRGRRRSQDPRAHAQEAGGWHTGLPAPARARRDVGAVSERVKARRRPGRRG